MPAQHEGKVVKVGLWFKPWLLSGVYGYGVICAHGWSKLFSMQAFEIFSGRGSLKRKDTFLHLVEVFLYLHQCFHHQTRHGFVGQLHSAIQEDFTSTSGLRMMHRQEIPASGCMECIVIVSLAIGACDGGGLPCHVA